MVLFMTDFIKEFHWCFWSYILLSKWFIFFWTQKFKFIPFPCKVFSSQNMHIIWDSSWIKCHIMSYNWIRIMWHRMFLQFTHNLKLRPFKFLHITNIQAYASMTKFWPSTLFSTIRMSHWRHTMVDVAKFWINCQRLAILSTLSCWQLIQNLTPSTIVWRQCDIRICNLHQLQYLCFQGKW